MLSCTVLETQDGLKAKNCQFVPNPLSFNALARAWVNPDEFRDELDLAKTRVFGLSFGKEIFAYFDTIPECNRQTGRQTDRQTDRSIVTIPHGMQCICYATALVINTSNRPTYTCPAFKERSQVK